MTREGIKQEVCGHIRPLRLNKDTIAGNIYTLIDWAAIAGYHQPANSANYIFKGILSEENIFSVRNAEQTKFSLFPTPYSLIDKYLSGHDISLHLLMSKTVAFMLRRLFRHLKRNFSK